MILYFFFFLLMLSFVISVYILTSGFGSELPLFLRVGLLFVFVFVCFFLLILDFIS